MGALPSRNDPLAVGRAGGAAGGRRSIFIRLLSPLLVRGYCRTQDCPVLSERTLCIVLVSPSVLLLPLG